MASPFRRLIQRFYPPNLGHTITILGLDYSGKTTLLYLLSTSEVVRTIPTIGLNVETVNAPVLQNGGGTNKSNIVRFTGWDIGTGCGSHYLYGMLRFYMTMSDAVIWMVDSSDRERLQDSVDSLAEVLKEVGSEHKTRMCPVLILANKADKLDTLSLDDIRIAFSKVLYNRITSIYPTSLTKPVMQGGLPQAFYWLQTVLELTKQSNKPDAELPSDILSSQRSTNQLTEKIKTWLIRTESDSSPDDFLSQFKSFTLPDWDHYTHIRVAFTVLMIHGRKEGKNMILDGIEKYIANSSQTNGRKFHFTMTLFWIQIVHFGIQNLPPNVSDTPAQDTASANLDEFGRFILLNPYVANGNLWGDYYSKDLMMSQEAKSAMILPDRKPLPSLVVRDTIKSLGVHK